MAEARISIIIPVLNEGKTISETIAHLANNSNLEVIVVDGGSQDDTVMIARSQGVQVICAPIGRAQQMNAGAAIATGDILLFLHADTRLPPNFPSLVRQALQHPGTIAGAFELGIDDQMLGLRLIERMANWRSQFLSMPYGDQAIFVQASIFHNIGGFPNLPIMEDFEFIRSLKKSGKIAIVPASVLTSARRWQKLGIIQTTLINQLMIIGYFLRVPPAKLVTWYRGHK